MEDNSPSTVRVVLCGLAAGIVHFAVTGVFNGVLLKEELRLWMDGAGGVLHPLPPLPSMTLWATMSACYGLIGIWYYVGMRGRTGAGFLTALLVGLSLWVVTKATVALDLFALGMMPTRILVGQSVGGLVAIVLAIVVGASSLERRGPARMSSTPSEANP